MRKNTQWTEYPRPQMQRDSFICLNGAWDFCVTGGKLPEAYTREITVPYPVESELSGIGEHFARGTVLWYRRFFTLPGDFLRDRTLLHCGAIDQKAEIFVNGSSVGVFCTAVEGPVVCDITDHLITGENEIIFRVVDDLDENIPYGKQREKKGGIWYTPFSGIWQSVWMESVPDKHIESLKITPFSDRVEIQIAGNGVDSGTIECEGIRTEYHEGKAVFHPAVIRPWSPEFPYLYYFSVKSGEDEVFSYFALRTVTVENIGGYPRICLNGKPYFFHGLLDQGYLHDGICTPQDASAYKWDILAAKRMGFNTLRKHIKIEPEEFYYECDRIGMIVFQDMVNSGHYSFFRDSVLPTLGFQKKNDKGKASAGQAANFTASLHSTVERLYNHPCIVSWTIFNEGWGQFDSDRAYRTVKTLDSTRFADSASGWFRSGATDVCSLHVYFRKFRMPGRQEKPVVLSEFGGYTLKVEGHSFNEKEPFGYRPFTDSTKFMTALEKLYMTQIVPSVERGLCGAIYTQLSDVEDELNGLLTFDRNAVKADEQRMRAIAELLCAGNVAVTEEIHS